MHRTARRRSEATDVPLSVMNYKRLIRLVVPLLLITAVGIIISQPSSIKHLSLQPDPAPAGGIVQVSGLGFVDENNETLVPFGTSLYWAREYCTVGVPELRLVRSVRSKPFTLGCINALDRSNHAHCNSLNTCYNGTLMSDVLPSNLRLEPGFANSCRDRNEYHTFMGVWGWNGGQRGTTSTAARSVQ